MHKFIQNNITKKYLNCQYQITQTRFPRFARAGAKPKNMPLEQQKRHIFMVDKINKFSPLFQRRNVSRHSKALVG